MHLRVLHALGVMLGAVGCAGCGARVAVTNQDVANLARRTAEANVALVHGDIDGYLTLIKHAKDYTLMAPFGGAPTRGFDTLERAPGSDSAVFQVRHVRPGGRGKLRLGRSHRPRDD